MCWHERKSLCPKCVDVVQNSTDDETTCTSFLEAWNILLRGFTELVLDDGEQSPEWMLALFMDHREEASCLLYAWWPYGPSCLLFVCCIRVQWLRFRFHHLGALRTLGLFVSVRREVYWRLRSFSEWPVCCSDQSVWEDDCSVGVSNGDAGPKVMQASASRLWYHFS